MGEAGFFLPFCVGLMVLLVTAYLGRPWSFIVSGESNSDYCRLTFWPLPWPEILGQESFWIQPLPRIIYHPWNHWWRPCCTKRRQLRYPSSLLNHARTSHQDCAAPSNFHSLPEPLMKGCLLVVDWVLPDENDVAVNHGVSPSVF